MQVGPGYVENLTDGYIGDIIATYETLTVGTYDNYPYQGGCATGEEVFSSKGALSPVCDFVTTPDGTRIYVLYTLTIDRKDTIDLTMQTCTDPPFPLDPITDEFTNTERYLIVDNIGVAVGSTGTSLPRGYALDNDGNLASGIETIAGAIIGSIASITATLNNGISYSEGTTPDGFTSLETRIIMSQRYKQAGCGLTPDTRPPPDGCPAKIAGTGNPCENLLSVGYAVGKVIAEKFDKDFATILNNVQ